MRVPGWVHEVSPARFPPRSPLAHTPAVAATKKRKPAGGGESEPAAPSAGTRARAAVQDAIGRRKLWLLLDHVDGDASVRSVALSLAVPPGLVDRVRAQPAFARAIDDLRAALATALPESAIALSLVAPAFETTPEALALALSVSGDHDLARALDLPRSHAEAGDVEATQLRLAQIEATALRRMSIKRGAELAPPSEPLDAGADRGAVSADRSTTRSEPGRTDVAPAAPGPVRAPEGASAPAAGTAPTGLEWLPARMLERRASGARDPFWLIARVGSTVSVRRGARMRSLKETRRAHPDREAAERDFASRVEAQLAAGYVPTHADGLEDVLLYHEPVVPELDREIIHRAARELLAKERWRHSLAAQVLVRALAPDGTPRTAEDADLSRALTERIAAAPPS